MLLSKYIAKTVIGTIFIVILILSGLEIFIEFTREFSNLGIGSYGLLQVLQYVPLMLPQDIYQLFPMAGLLGSLIGLGVLASNSELTVMRASGMSVTSIGLAVLKAAFFLTLIMVLVGEVLAPIAQHKAVKNRSIAMSGGQILVTTQGVWAHNRDNFIHIDEVSKDGHLKSILRYKFDKENKLLFASFAKEGFCDPEGNCSFKDIVESKFSDNNITNTTMPDANWGVSLSPKFLWLAKLDTEEKSILELNKYIKYLESNGLNSDRYKLIFWQRIFEPLAILVMIFLAVPFIFSFLRTRTMGFRIMIGAVVGFGFYMLDQFIGPLAIVCRFPVMVAALLPIVLFFLLALFLTKTCN